MLTRGTMVSSRFPFPNRNRSVDSNDDTENLPGQFAVWAASNEAKFLHGRFVWAKWDVTELREGPIRERLDDDEQFLRVGVVGIENFKNL